MTHVDPCQVGRLSALSSPATTLLVLATNVHYLVYSSSNLQEACRCKHNNKGLYFVRTQKNIQY